MGETVLVVRAYGSPRDIGRQVGEATAPMIARLSEDFVRFLGEEAQKGSCTFLSRESLWRLSEQQLVALNSFLDLFDLNYPFLADQLLFGCTALGIAPPASTDGETYVAQTYDFRTYFRPAVYVLELVPKDAPPALLLCMAGMVGCAGINGAGIGLVINNLVPSDSRHGVPFCFIVRKALQQRHLGQAIRVILSARRASGLNYLLGSADGVVLSLETTATTYEVLSATEGRLVHANHYLHERLHPYDRRNERASGSILRQSRADTLLAELAGNMDSACVQTLLRDHASRPNSICCHPDESVSPVRDETLASIICRLNAREVLVALGPPCEGDYKCLRVPPE